MVTFVVRFWREAAGSGVRWRGRIEHVQTGVATAFLDLETMVKFMERFEIASTNIPAVDKPDSLLDREC
jgi:hypothetical protein